MWPGGAPAVLVQSVGRLAAEKVNGGGGGLGGCGGGSVGAAPHVVGAVDQEEFDGGARGFQRFGEAGGLGGRNEPVGGSVGQEKRRGVAMDVAERAGCGGFLRRVGGLGAEQERLAGAWIVGTGHGVRQGLAAHPHQIGGRVPRGDGSDPVLQRWCWRPQ